MKTLCKLATFILMMTVLAVSSFAQETEKAPAAALANLVEGQGIIASTSNPQWDGLSELVLIPGAALMGASSTTTSLYLGFTGGSEADIGNMVVYTTARGSAVITAVTPVTLGGVSDPSIILSNTSVCPVAPSTTTPCIVRFDPTAITFSPANDYYLMVYYTNDTNNSGLGGAQAGNLQSSLSSNYFGGTDYTRLTAGQSVPGTGDRGPVFLMYVMND